jgi:hypothetical protein
MLVRVILAATVELSCGGADRAPAPVATAAPRAAHRGSARPDAPVHLPAGTTRSLIAAVESIDAGSPGAAARIARAFDALADALAALPETGGLATELRSVRARLSGKHLEESEVAAITRDGLSLALRALAHLTPPTSRQDDVRASIAVLGHSLRTLDRAPSLPAEADSIERAFGAAADAVLELGDERPLFGSTRSKLPAGSVDSFAAAVTRARRAIDAVPGAVYPRERPTLAAALDALADCLAAAPDKSEDVDAAIETIRYSATRIRSGRWVELHEAHWVKQALDAGLEAFGKLPLARGEELAAWLDSARRSSSLIEPYSGLAFQRARVQDALRATIDAFATAAARGQAAATRS